MILINKYRYWPIFNTILTQKEPLKSNEEILCMLEDLRENVLNNNLTIENTTKIFDQLILLGANGLGVKDADSLHDTIFGTTNVGATGEIAELMEEYISTSMHPLEVIGRLMDLVYSLIPENLGYDKSNEKYIYQHILAITMTKFKG